MVSFVRWTVRGRRVSDQQGRWVGGGKVDKRLAVSSRPIDLVDDQAEWMRGGPMAVIRYQSKLEVNICKCNKLEKIDQITTEIAL